MLRRRRAHEGARRCCVFLSATTIISKSPPATLASVPAKPCGRRLVRPLQPDARRGPVRRGEPRHRYPDPRGDEGHRAVGPALQGGRRRVHDHDGDDQPRHRPAGEEPGHLRAQGKHPGDGALIPTPSRSSCLPCALPSPAALRGGGEAVMLGLIEAFIDRLAQVLETPATRSTTSRTRCSAAAAAATSASRRTCSR